MKLLLGLASVFFLSACSSSDDPPLASEHPLPDRVQPKWVATYTETSPDATELDPPEISHTTVEALLEAAEGEPGPAAFYDQAWLLIAHGYRNNLTQVFPAPDVIFESSAPRNGRGALWAFDGCQLVEGEFTLDGQTLTSSTQYVNTAGCFGGQYDVEIASIYESRSQFFWSTLAGLTHYELVNDLLVLTSAEAGVLVLRLLGD